MNSECYWIWVVDDATWSPNHEAETLADAVAAARQLAQECVVAIDANGEWFRFPESGRTILAPPDTDPRSITAPGYETPRRELRRKLEWLRQKPTVRLDGILLRLVDFSERGLRLALPRRRRTAVGDVLRLHLEDTATRLELTARVVWSGPGKAGVELLWDDTTAAGRSYIRQLVRRVDQRTRRRSA